ncbi:hypothetical protein N8388_02380 [Octadecabacter sp.]|nr:hypothetical protein [Octadecabacter sp.]
MSDPVTNVEIEDVLFSIRRLVSDGDKARTRDPAQIVVAATEAARVTPDTAPELNDAAQKSDTSDRLVLTPAFLVAGGDDDRDARLHDAHDEEPAEAQPESDDWQEEDWPEAVSDDSDAEDYDGEDDDDQNFGADDHDFDDDDEDDDDAENLDAFGDRVEDAPQAAPLSLTCPVTDHAGDVAPDTTDGTTPVTDRSGLVATIAELEAAISEGEDDFEPDGSETMGQTIAWPGKMAARASDTIEDADVAEDPVDEMPDVQNVETPSFEHRTADEQSDPVGEDVASEVEVEDYDDDLDGLLDVGGATLDEESLRDLVASVVREELTGPLGERITRNVRKLVRREIYRILSSQEFD